MPHIEVVVQLAPDYRALRVVVDQVVHQTPVPAGDTSSTDVLCTPPLCTEAMRSCLYTAAGPEGVLAVDKVVVAHRTIDFDGLLFGTDSGVAPYTGPWRRCCFPLSHDCDDTQGSGRGSVLVGGNGRGVSISFRPVHETLMCCRIVGLWTAPDHGRDPRDSRPCRRASRGAHLFTAHCRVQTAQDCLPARLTLADHMRPVVGDQS